MDSVTIPKSAQTVSLKVSGGACTLWTGRDGNGNFYPVCFHAHETRGWLDPLLPVECREPVPYACPYQVRIELSATARELPTLTPCAPEGVQPSEPTA